MRKDFKARLAYIVGQVFDFPTQGDNAKVSIYGADRFKTFTLELVLPILSHLYGSGVVNKQNPVCTPSVLFQEFTASPKRAYKSIINNASPSRTPTDNAQYARIAASGTGMDNQNPPKSPRRNAKDFSDIPNHFFTSFSAAA